MVVIGAGIGIGLFVCDVSPAMKIFRLKGRGFTAHVRLFVVVQALSTVLTAGWKTFR